MMNPARPIVGTADVPRKLSNRGLTGPIRDNGSYGATAAGDKVAVLNVKGTINSAVSVLVGMRTTALNTLAHDVRVQQLLPQFVSGIVQGFNIFQLKDLGKLFHLARAINALYVNPSVNLAGQTSTLLQALGKLVISSQLPQSSIEGDHFKFRKYASSLIGRICEKLVDEYLPDRLASSFYDRFSKDESHLVSLYGAIVGILSLGSKYVLKWIVPQLGYISAKLDAMSRSPLDVEITDRIRKQLVLSVGPQLTNLQPKPNLGSLVRYFQRAGYLTVAPETGPSYRQTLPNHSLPPLSGMLNVRNNFPAKQQAVGGVARASNGPRTTGVLARGAMSKDEKYDEIITAVVGPRDDLRNEALHRLRSDPALHSLLPSFLTFVIKGAKGCKDPNYLMKLMRMLRAVTKNQGFPSVQQFQSDLFTTLGSCAVSGDLPINNDVHWLLRDYAVQVLAELCSGDSGLKQSVASLYGKVLLSNPPAPLSSLYSCIKGLSLLGPEIIRQYLIPKMAYISQRMDATLNLRIVERTRICVIEAVSPVLLTLENPPNTAEFGSLGRYFQLVDNVVAATSGTKRRAEKQLSVDTKKPTYQKVDAPKLGATGNRQNNTQAATPGKEAEIHVYGLQTWVTRENIENNFSENGTILEVWFPVEPYYCHILYANKEEAQKTMEAKHGKKLTIDSRIASKKLQITWARFAMCNVKSTEYFIFCQQHQICYNYNIADSGCSLESCSRKHICLFCYELCDTEEPHKSRFNCPNETWGFEHFGARQPNSRA